MCFDNEECENHFCQRCTYQIKEEKINEMVRPIFSRENNNVSQRLGGNNMVINGEVAYELIVARLIHMFDLIVYAKCPLC